MAVLRSSIKNIDSRGCRPCANPLDWVHSRPGVRRRMCLTSPVACVDIIGSHGAGVPTRIRPEAADEYLAAAEPIRSRGLVPLWDAGSRFLPSAEPPRRATAPSARQLAKCTKDSVTNPRKLNRSPDGIQWSEDGHGLGCFSGVGH